MLTCYYMIIFSQCSVYFKVREFESRLNDYNRMRYPDCESRPDGHVPSDLYKEDDATFALEKSKAIIDTVKECFDM